MENTDSNIQLMLTSRVTNVMQFYIIIQFREGQNICKIFIVHPKILNLTSIMTFRVAYFLQLNTTGGILKKCSDSSMGFSYIIGLTIQLRNL